jgi:Holliday junction resolvase-like predicted endonuclease
MLTSLPKHRGQHGGLIAVGVLVATSAVVYTTSPKDPEPAPKQETSEVIRSSVQRPAASVAKTPEAVAPALIPPTKAAVPADRTRATGTGYVTYDETRTSHVAVPVSGWLVKKRPASVGRAVRQFEPLATVYSVEVYMATVDLLEQVREFRSQEQLNQARIKLLRWGMPKPTLDQIEHTMKPQAALPIVSRVAGIVVSEAGMPRGFVEPSELFIVTDPTNVMVFVEVPDAEAALLAVGMPAKITVEGVEKTINAKVSYIFRRSEDGKRTVRFDVHSYLKLKPGSKADAVISLKR